MRRARRIAVAVSLVGSGCQQVERIEIAEACGVPDEVQQIFSANCTMAACHGSGSAEAGLSLEPGASDSILERNSTQNTSLRLVAIGNVAGSWLAIKIEDELPDAPTRTGDAMPPPTAPPLLDADRATIIGWIAGAQLQCSTGDTDTETATGSGSESSTSTGAESRQACGIDDLKPGAPNPIDAGTRAEQIPPDIAEVLAISCGCHYTDDLVADVIDYPTMSPLHIDTLAGFRETLSTTGGPAHVAVLDRLTGNGFPMPPPPCEVEPGVAISPADRDRLIAWLEAGIPDGATWDP